MTIVNVKSRVDRVNDLRTAVENHCMCARFVETKHHYMAQYPDGFFPAGVRADISAGTAIALERVLETMEKHWKNSFPSAKHS